MSRGYMSQGVHVLGVSVQGVHVRGGYVLEPTCLYIRFNLDCTTHNMSRMKVRKSHNPEVHNVPCLHHFNFTFILKLRNQYQVAPGIISLPMKFRTQENRGPEDHKLSPVSSRMVGR